MDENVGWPVMIIVVREKKEEDLKHTSEKKFLKHSLLDYVINGFILLKEMGQGL